MKIIILKENLNNGLNIVGRLAGRNLTLPILNNILISTEKNFLNLCSTDLELAIKYWGLAKIEREGKITVPAKVLSNFIGFLSEGKITLEVKGQNLYLECANYRTQIKGLSVEEYPIIPKIENQDFIELNTALLAEGMAQVADFAAINQARPELSGVYFNFQKDKLQLTSTDSFRLAEKTLYFEKKADKEYSFILPQKTVREFINILSEKKGKTKLYFSPNQIMFEYSMQETAHPEIQIISRLIEGEYPDYQAIIPQKYEIQALLPKNEFLNQIKTASIFSGKGNEIKIRVNPKKEGIEILSENPELGENKSFLSGKVSYTSSPQETEIIFNHRFLIDGLSNIKKSQVVFDLNGEEGAAVLRPEGDPNYLYVVMPIKTA